MSTIPVRVALVDETSHLSASDVDELAGALNQQFADFQRLWRTHYHASVVALAPASLTPGDWAIRLQHGIDEAGALGYHTDEHNQPYAVVDVSQGDWTVTASHEFLEMAGDPFGNFLHSGPAPRGWSQAAKYRHVKFLREACDPCEVGSYQIGNVLVSDFLTLDWYGYADRGRAGFSFLGALTSPGEVADGGYVSWMIPSTGEWWQRFTEGGQAHDQSLGTYDKAEFASLREFTDHHARLYRAG